MPHLNPKKRKKGSAPASVSHIAQHLYNSGSRELTITFHNGRTYRYSGVDPRTAAGLSKAPSKGSYFHAHIRDKHETREMPRRD